MVNIFSPKISSPIKAKLLLKKKENMQKYVLVHLSQCCDIWLQPIQAL